MAKKSKKRELSIFSWANFKSGFGWIMLFLGVGFLILGIFITKSEAWKEIFIELGKISLIGVLFDFVSRSAQFMGIFKKDLEDIVYATKFLKIRNDINIIWENVSKVLFKSKFPAISHDLLETIKSIYFPLKEISYYSDYNFSINLEWDSEDKQFIKVTQKLAFDLLAETKEKFIFDTTNWINVESLSKEEYYIKTTEYLVNKSAAKVVNVEEKLNGNDFSTKIEIELFGSEKYNISRKVEKRYNIEKDYHIGFKAKYIVNNLRVQMFYPKDLSVCFLERGTTKEFKDGNTRNGYLERHYKGLILPKQGFFILLKKI
jgi:hypothetical protein